MDKRSWIDLFCVRHPHLNDNPQYIAAQVERAFNTILIFSFRNDYSNFDLYSKRYSGIEVTQDSEDTWYSDVPVRLIQLPDTAESVRRITASKDQKTIIFVSVPKDSWSTFNLLDVSKVSAYIPYSVTNGRVEYARKPPVESVSMDLVRAFMDYDDNEEIPVPAGHEQEFEQLIETFLQGTPPPNKVNL